jgi:DNA-binding beta-propeller fold protein YncE
MEPVMKNHLTLTVRFSAWMSCLFAALFLVLTGSALAAPFVTVGNQSTNEVSVIDMANFTARVIAPLDGATRIVASKPAGKVFMNTTTGIAIIDPALAKVVDRIAIPEAVTDLVVDAAGRRLYALSAASVRVINITMRTVLATIPLSAAPLALVADDEGARAYVLSPGRLDMIYAPSGAVIKSVALDPSASALALTHNNGKLIVASSGNNGGIAGITIVHGASLAIEKSMPTAALAADVHPDTLVVSPDDDKVLVFGRGSTNKTVSYLVLDLASATVRAVQVPITQSPQSLLTAFNGPVLLGPDGKKLYVGGGSTPNANVVAEIDTVTNTNSRVLALPTNGAEYHYLNGLASSDTDGRFVLVGFIFEHRIHSAGEPHSVGFVDVASGTVMANVVFGQSTLRSTALFGDVLDPGEQEVHSTTTLLLSEPNPAAMTATQTFSANVSGEEPSGKVVFIFKDGNQADPLIARVAVALKRNIATLTLPSCATDWPNAILHRIACSARFLVTARYQGDDDYLKSRSQEIVASRY